MRSSKQFRQIFGASSVILVPVVVMPEEPLTTTVKTVQPTSGTGATLQVNPWPRLIGKYKNDPSWEGFDDFLKEYRAGVDQLFNSGVDED